MAETAAEVEEDSPYWMRFAPRPHEPDNPSMLRGALAAALVGLGALILFSGWSRGQQHARRGEQPLSLHPENSNYFLFRGKPTILVGSGVYGAVIHRDFDYIVYLNELSRLGLNQTRLFTGSYVARSSPVGEGYADSLVPRDRLLAPWARSAVPGYALGGNKFDLDRWDPKYFGRLRSFVAEAGRRGVIVEIVFFSANYGDSNWSASPMQADNNVNGIGRVAANETYRLDGEPALLEAQERLVEKIVRELSPFDNVYYEPLNEPHHAACPDGVPSCDPPGDWEELMIGVVDRTERSLGRRHLIARGVGNVGFEIGNVPSTVSILNFHYARPQAVSANRKLGLAIADDETGLQGPSDQPYRTEGWEFMLAAGAVFSNLDWTFTANREDGTQALPEDFHYGGGGVELRHQLAFMKRFLESFDLVHLRPAQAVIRRWTPAGATVHALGRRGREYAIYVSGGGGVARLALDLPPGRYRLTWHDPKTGRMTKRAKLAHAGGEATVVSPRYSDDLALAIRSIRG